MSRTFKVLIVLALVVVAYKLFIAGDSTRVEYEPTE
jgi:hypothetical protein